MYSRKEMFGFPSFPPFLHDGRDKATGNVTMNKEKDEPHKLELQEVGLES